MGGVTSKIILRNSTIPASGREMFTTGVDGQTAVDVHVLQGERELASDCRSLARFRLRGIPPMPAGLPRIEVRFQIDANGILSVSAKELRTDIEQAIDVKPSYGLTDAEVERMVKDAQSHASEDQARRDLIDARNQADSLAYQVEKTVNDNRTKIAVGELSTIEAAIAEVRRVAQTDDLTAIRNATEALQRASHAIAEQLYKQAQAPASDASARSEQSSNVKDAEVVDAEYAETR
jgi:molecular chaperone DnaK